MPHAINYRVTTAANGDDACEIHINGKLALVLKRSDSQYRVIADPNFGDASVTAEELQNAIEGAAEKLESAL